MSEDTNKEKELTEDDVVMDMPGGGERYAVIGYNKSGDDCDDAE